MTKNFYLGLLIATMSYRALAQAPSKPALRQGVHVEMATASHAVPMPEADANDATVVSVKDTGEVFIGVHAATLADLKKISASIVYVKADARVRYQSLLGVIDALHGRSVVLLAQPTTKPPAGETQPPYGISLGSGH